jgi:hypothetical protein
MLNIGKKWECTCYPSSDLFQGLRDINRFSSATRKSQISLEIRIHRSSIKYFVNGEQNKQKSNWRSPTSFVGRKMFEIANYPYRGAKNESKTKRFGTDSWTRTLSLSLSFCLSVSLTTVSKRQASEMTITSVLRSFVLRNFSKWKITLLC